MARIRTNLQRDHVSENLWRFFLRFFLSTVLPFLVNTFLFYSNLLFAYSFLSMYTMYTGMPERKRPLWKPSLRRQDNIKIHIKGILWEDADWIHLAHSWDFCLDLVQVVLHMHFPANTSYFLTSWDAVGFSKRTLFLLAIYLPSCLPSFLYYLLFFIQSSLTSTFCPLPFFFCLPATLKFSNH